MRFKRELTIGAALLSAVIVLAYSNILFRGQTLVSTSNYSPIDDRFTHLRIGEMKGAGFLNWHDQGGVWWQWEPAAQFFGLHYRQGTVPMWDPTIAGGVDTHVNVTQSQYFLPHALVLLLGNTPFQRDMYYLLLLLASGVACFALLRRNGFHRTSAVFMGAGFMLSGVMTQNVNALLGQTFATLPVFLLAADVLLDRLTWRAWGGAALVIGLCTYSSFLPIVISGYVLIAIQAVAYAVSRSPEKAEGAPGIAVRQIVMFGVTVLTALALAAFVLIPVAAVQHANSAFHTWYTGIGQMHYSMDLLATLVSPRLFYDVYQTFPPAGAMIPKPQPWTTHFFYVGFLIVTLIPVARWDSRPRVRRLTLFFASASLLFFMKLMGVPPVQWIANLPVFEFLHFIPYFSGAFGLALVGLAACSVESVIQHGVGRRQFVAATVMAAIAIAGVVFLVVDQGTNPAATDDARQRYTAEAFRVAVVVAALLLTLFFRWRGRIGGQVAGAIVMVLLAIELVPIAHHRRFLRSDIWKNPPEYVQFLKQDPGLFRVQATQDPALPPNTFQAFGISGISSLGVFNAPRYTELIKKYFETVANSSFILTRSLLPTHRPVLDLLNVKYVVTHGQSADQVRELAASGFVPAVQDGNFNVYKNTRVWPRAFVAHDYTTVSDATAAISALASLQTRDRVVLEHQPGFAPSVQPASECVIDAYEPNTIRISGDSPGVGMLVVLDSFGEGWSATLNGQPATIVAAFGAFRGVQVPRGRWQVTMTYRSPSAGTGLTLSLFALAIALAALVAPRRSLA